MIPSDLKILLAEDNIINQRVVVSILKKADVETDIANNGEEVLQAIKAKRYDLILMDMQMPVMDGITATKKIREEFSDQNIPIIALTANAMSNDRDKCLEAGMNDYIAKPININELYKKINEVISN